MPVVGSVYLVTNMINGKQYVGQTTRNPMWRWGEYKRGQRGMVSRAIRKYGAHNFQFEILIQDIDSQWYLDQCEMYYIRMYGTLHPNGYNLLEGGYGLGRAAARGDRNGSRTHPESRVRGDKHWTRIRPHVGPRKLTDHQVQIVLFLYCSGWTMARIGARMGVSTATVCRVMARSTGGI